MKSGGWIPLDKGLVIELPKDRPYTTIEAVFSMQLDYDNNHEVTVSGYADLWQWPRTKVRRFMEKMGIEIRYSEDTTRIKNQRGLIKIIKIYKKNPKKELRFIDSKPKKPNDRSAIKPAIKKTYQTEENQQVAEQIGHKKNISLNTTIYPREPNTNNSSKKCPFAAIFDLFRECLPELPKPIKVTTARKAQLKARWLGGYQASSGLKSDCSAFWEGFFQFIRQSDFLMGRNGKFQATFDWIIKESNFVKILEGNYHK
jgi:hypothetical protein